MFFPSQLYNGAGEYASAYFENLACSAKNVDMGKVTEAGNLLKECINKGNFIYSCGNGGSAAISNHLLCDCLKGVSTGTSLRPRVVSLSSPVELMTAIANDIGYEDVFSFQLQSLAKPGDVLIAISSSGNSDNIINALEFAAAHNMKTIAMTGFSGGRAAELADISLYVPAENYGVVEDIHQSLMHILAQYLRHLHLNDKCQIGKINF